MYFNISEAKTHLSRLIEKALNGEEVIISRSNKPCVKITPYIKEESARTGGQWKGLVRMSEDFEDPLPASIADAFKGKK